MLDEKSSFARAGRTGAPAAAAVSVAALVPEHKVVTGAQLLAENAYRPWPARITDIVELTPDVKLFQFRIVDGRVREAFVHEPGQFVELSLFGVGEVPISISSSPTKPGFVELCVRRTGAVTRALHNMRCGDTVGLRGPFGRGFPVREMRGNDILVVAGGLGLAPARSLINYIHDERADFGRVTIVYGSHDPAGVLFADEIEMWRRHPGFDVRLTVDEPDSTWEGDVGPVAAPMGSLEIDPGAIFGVMCGPSAMYRAVVGEMRAMGISYDRIYMSFERHMKCGMGKCGHCQIGHQYCCIDGPVFNSWEAKNIQGSM